ncbi:MAG: thioether cross-link-forming SCIFF peptide maturase [Oscillospiraceae bacterium]|jgi:uncharacterized protein|nr:thioether cross-link-forming SCIFF peptide maturase [Oscillospiraceae bacterium]
MIHAYQCNGYHIVLDIGSGAVHVTDPAAYEAIVRLDRGEGCAAVSAALATGHGLPSAETDELLADIEMLRRRGQLFAPEAWGEGADAVDYASLAAAHRAKEPVVKALCLHVSHTCDLACRYCFAQAGRYHGPEALMSFGVGRQALDFLLAHAGTRRHLEVDFFGGEPLLNWDVVKRLVAYARGREAESGKRFRFTLTTNGMRLDDEVTDFCNREMSNVVLSLDGRRETHDRLRRTPADAGSYDTVVPKFQRFVERRRGGTYYMRGTFTHENPDFTRDLLHMASLGFRQLSMEPVVAAPGDPLALSPADLGVILAEYERLAAEMARRQGTAEAFSFYHFNLDLAHGPCLYKRVTGCGAGTEYLAVTPTGDFYPCHQFVGDPAFRLGNVRDGLTNPALIADFRACTLYTRPTCRDCWARLYCSGGCCANAYHASGSIRGVYEDGCTLFRKRIECAIMLQAAAARRNGDAPSPRGSAQDGKDGSSP